MKPAYKYQIGGSLEKDAPSYVKRQADDQFYQALKAGEFCYVLNSRQMGKSSLRVQTMRRLQADGIACAVIDITSIGSHDIAASEWYLGLIRRLSRSLGLKVKLIPWWNEHEGLSPIQRLGEFIETVLLTEIADKIVIFIDEIDSILRLDFKDDFFALIRACYNQRADNQQYHRLTFALLGVATPSDLIEDKTRTPFNIGSAIELRGFRLQEVQPLAKGLEGKADNPQEVLKEILAWTGGQPFLTQKLCQLVVSSPFNITAGSEGSLMEQLVRSRLIDNWEAQDEPEHLRTIRDRLLRNEKRASRLLGLYQQILQQGGVVSVDCSEQMELRLSGLVVRQQGKLRVYNRIYNEVFNSCWVEKQLASLRPYSEAFTAWLDSNCQDESRLLRGQALQESLAWAANKSLSEGDYQFLTASQELDKREVQIALERQIKERESEKREAQIALQAERKSREEVLQKLKGVANFRVTGRGRCMIVFISVTVTITGWLTGLLQLLEWSAYDQLVRLRPPEPRDERIVIVGITESDLQKVKQLIVPDLFIARLLEKIKQQKPLVIGLNLYRSLPYEPGYQNLVKVYESTPNLIGIKKVVVDENGPAVNPPPQLLKRGQVSANDLLLDADGKIRRAFLYLTPDGKTIESLGLRLALMYLKTKGIEPKAAPKNPDHLQLGKTVFANFEKNDGGYIRADDRGYQMLINYRDPANSFKMVSMTDVLENRVPPDLMRDRIVLIGSTAPSQKDFFSTPYSTPLIGVSQRISGVEIHANITSQIISAALERRPLIKSFPEPVEWLWIAGWAILGGCLPWKIRHIGILILSSTAMLVVLYLISYLSLLIGVWIPVVASIFAWVVGRMSLIAVERTMYIYEVLKLIEWIRLKNQSVEDALREDLSESK